MTYMYVYMYVVPPDVMPMWRKIVWSQDSSLIAVGRRYDKLYLIFQCCVWLRLACVCASVYVYVCMYMYMYVC